MTIFSDLEKNELIFLTNNRRIYLLSKLDKTPSFSTNPEAFIKEIQDELAMVYRILEELKK